VRGRIGKGGEGEAERRRGDRDGQKRSGEKGKTGEKGGGREGREREEKSVSIVPALRKHHCHVDGPQTAKLLSLYNVLVRGTDNY